MSNQVSTPGDPHERQPQEGPAIVISGVDEPEPGAHNLSPTEEAAERLKLQRERDDPEDEDG